MKTFILFVILIDYINGSPPWNQYFQQDTTTDSYAPLKFYTKILATPTGICEETEDTISLNVSYAGL